jgi:AAA15 family ATPase/GTPase
MTDLERIEIEGFKGLERVEIEPTDINLITGRNNTGKTSFLEAVDLACSPTNIRQFNENAKAIVKRGFSEAAIKTETDAKTNGLIIRSASANEADQCLRRILTKHFQSSIKTGTKREGNEGGRPFTEYHTSSIEGIGELEEKFQEVVSKMVSSAVRKIPDSLRGVYLVVELNGEEYPYVYLERSDWRLMVELNAILEDVLLEEFDEEVVEKHPDSYLVQDTECGNHIIEFNTNRSHHLVGGQFLRELPELGSAIFVNQEGLRNNIEDPDDETNAVRVDDIGDFLKDKGLVDNLKTFNLDTLIFQTNDGEKYPVPYEFMGDGFKSMVNLLWELMDDEVENEIVLIEEPENHMHPGYVSELVHFLIDLARDEDIQFFITTHDHNFIKDFFMDMPEEKREYLEDEFSLVKMDDFGADVMNYEDAEHHLKDLHLDLRGI